jgi:elongator complex protein 1
MRNLVASSIRRWRLPLAPNLASADGASEQIVATCYDAESRVTYAVTDACNLYGVRDSAREGDDAELCLEMCLVESVPSATDAFDTRDVADDAVGNDARAGVDGDEKDDERNHLASPRTDEASEAPSNPNEPPLALVGEGPEDGPDASEVSAYQPALQKVSPIVGAAFVDDLRGVCVACATGELLLVAPDPEDDDEGMAPGAILTKDMAPECVGRVAQGLRAMRWNPDGELLVLATWAGTLILMTKEFRVLAEAPVGGGGGDGVASLSWRGDGQFLASLVAVRGGEPQLRVWEREDLTFHATGESLRPARISAGDPRGNCPSGDTFESSSGKTEKLSLPHAPPLAWQPRGALVAVACAPQRAREDSDVDSTSASDALDEEARVSRRDAKNTEKNDKKRPPPLPATEAEIVFFERNGLRRGSFRLPARGAGVEVTSLAWSCDSERLAVCVADPEAAVFEKKSRSGSGEDGDDFRGDFGAATQIWRRGNGKWYLSREVRFSTREGPKVYCAWDLSNPDVLRIATPNGRVEEHVLSTRFRFRRRRRRRPSTAPTCLSRRWRAR